MRMELLGCPFGKYWVFTFTSINIRPFFALRGGISLGGETSDRSYNCKHLVQFEFGIRRGHNQGRFERRMYVSEVFFILEFLDDAKFVLLSFFTLVEAICPNIWANKLPKNEKKKPTSGRTWVAQNF